MKDVTQLIRSIAADWYVDGCSETLNELHEQARALAEPILDHEAAARAAGWNLTSGEDGGDRYFQRRMPGCRMEGRWSTWEDLCQLYDLAPIERPVVSFHLVDEHQADEIEQDGGTWFLGQLYPGRIDRNFAGLIILASVQ